jgi:hypothetical protein
MQCTECGQPVSAGDRRCPLCGEEFARPAATSESFAPVGRPQETGPLSLPGFEVDREPRERPRLQIPATTTSSLVLNIDETTLPGDAAHDFTAVSEVEIDGQPAA